MSGCGATMFEGSARGDGFIKEKKPSIRKSLKRMMERAAKQQVLEKTKSKVKAVVR